MGGELPTQVPPHTAASRSPRRAGVRIRGLALFLGLSYATACMLDFASGGAARLQLLLTGVGGVALGHAVLLAATLCEWTSGGVHGGGVHSSDAWGWMGEHEREYVNPRFDAEAVPPLRDDQWALVSTECRC